jgi:hypothetical protein
LTTATNVHENPEEAFFLTVGTFHFKREWQCQTFTVTAIRNLPLVIVSCDFACLEIGVAISKKSGSRHVGF